MRSILAAASAGRALSGEEAEMLPRLLPGGFIDLLAAAGAARAAGRSIPFTCGIINAKSGRCGEDCAFCAQSRYHDSGVAAHPLVGEEKLLARAESLAKTGVTYMGIVTSGVSLAGRDFDRVCLAARRISQEVGIRLCASLGLLADDQALALKEAGFTSYHHNLESAGSYYSRICTTHTYQSRVDTVRKVAAAGLRVCSGGIFGLGEGWAQRLEMSMTLGELGVDSIPINFLTPIAGTPLENAPGLDAREALAVIALFRLMHPERDIVVCGGRGRTLGQWENSLFFAGANGLMLGDYLTTLGTPLEKDLAMLRFMGVMGLAENG
ncbi:MAG: biotin synthase BioB [Deltaproteobacteria bacterium]|nr:biotin synthase BioB [Deltaproteobacteria bacterium]